ncbi:MAG: hypothetical protein JSV39_01430 [Candidatus Aenigmatarchaeota archaeon]|nr:MAG: hypothetical protein JSV39_01430 [Candidatus Aenigmarchaeota archaeon]
MAETLRDACTPLGTKKWHWYNVVNDLVQQGGLKKGYVQWSFKSPDAFTYKNKPFYMTWVKDKILLVSRENDDGDFRKLVKAFSSVVEYDPFCKYVEPDNNWTTYEWDKENAEGRFKELQEGGEKLNLRKVKIDKLKRLISSQPV